MFNDEPSDLEWAIASRVMMHQPAIGPLTKEQQEAEDDYVRWNEEMERVCGCSISTGGFDPYGTSCDLERGHEGPHEGCDFFGVGRLRWTGGGSCVGDALPFTIVEHVKEGT